MVISVVHQVSETGEVDVGDTIKATFIGAAGAVVGTVTASLVGAGFAAAGITGAFTATQAFAIGATTSAISGMTVRANTAVLQGLVLPEEKQPILTTFDNALREALDPTAITVDAAMGGLANALYFEVQQALNKQQTAVCEEEKLEEITDATDSNSKASSKVLRKNLIQSGIEAPDYPNAAHHIVTGKDPKAAEARAILQKYGIDINDAANGVFLPTVKGVSEGAYHPSLHTNPYYDEVNNLLREASSKQDVLDILSFISESLQNGTFMK